MAMGTPGKKLAKVAARPFARRFSSATESGHWVRKVSKDGQGVEWVQVSAEEAKKVVKNGGEVAANPLPLAPETSTPRGGGGLGSSVAIGMVAAVGAGGAAYYMIQEGIIDAPELKSQLPFKLQLPEGMPEIKLPYHMPKVSDIKFPEDMPVLKMPEWMPNLSKVSFPKMLEGVPQMPKLPEGLPDLKMPDISMPKLPEGLANLEMPDISMPKLPKGLADLKVPDISMPKLPEALANLKMPDISMPKLPEGLPEMPRLPEGLSDIKMPELPKGIPEFKMPKLPEGLSDLKIPDMPKMPEGVPKIPQLPELSLPEMGVADIKVPGGESIRDTLASLPDWKLPSLPALPSLPGFGDAKKAPASPAASENAAPLPPPPPTLEEQSKSREVMGKEEPVTHEDMKESSTVPTLAGNTEIDSQAESDGLFGDESRHKPDAQAETKGVFSVPVELPAVELEPEPKLESDTSLPAPDTDSDFSTASADRAADKAPGGAGDGDLEPDPLEELLKSQSTSPHNPPHPEPNTAPTDPAPATDAPASTAQVESEFEASTQDPKDADAEEEAEDQAEAARLQAVRDGWAHAEEEAERAGEEACTPPAPPAEEVEAKPVTPLTAMEAFEKEMLSKYQEDSELPFASFAMIFQAMKHQAGVDTAIFDKAMAAQKRQSQEEIDKLKQQLEAANEIVDSLQAAYQKQVTDADAAIARTEATLQREKEDELEEQKLQMMLDAEELNLKLRREHFEAKIAERAVRMQAIDSMRMKVNALHSAFGNKLKAPMVSHKAHRMAVGSFALAATLQEGEPFARELEWLTQVSEQDPLVLAAARAVPEATARSGAPTRTMLTEQFHHMKQTIRQKCLVPASGGGMVSSAVARLAAVLRVEEAPGVLSQSQGVEACLSTAQRLLADGHLLEAAALLEQAHAHTAAAPVVGQWAKAVRDRVVAEQMLELLETHAAAIAVGLS